LESGFTVLPTVVLECPSLSPQAKIVYAKIIDFAFNGLYSYPSQETIAERLKVHERTVRRAVQELLEFGLIKVYRSKAFGNNVYVLVPLEKVENLQGEFKPVDKGEQYLSQKEFDVIVRKADRFFNRYGGREAIVSDTWEQAQNKIEAENWDEMTPADFCVYFALKFKGQFNDNYGISWRYDTATIKNFLFDADIKGDDAKFLIDWFIENYNKHFANDKYRTPRIGHFKVNWIREKIYRLIMQEQEAEELQEQNEGGEYVDQF